MSQGWEGWLAPALCFNDKWKIKFEMKNSSLVIFYSHFYGNDSGQVTLPNLRHSILEWIIGRKAESDSTSVRL
jgi:hypothetical protein